MFWQRFGNFEGYAFKAVNSYEKIIKTKHLVRVNKTILATVPRPPKSFSIIKTT